jgi:Cytochrome c7 and related cytochrome c/Class III cytochrome C family
VLIRNQKLIRVFAFTGFAALLALCFVASLAATQRKPARNLKSKAATAKKPRIDYANFSHQTHVIQQKLACDSCHKFPTKNWKDVRAGDAAFPDVAEFPEHSACFSCHRQQFFARERPAPLICSNCHVANSPRDTSRFLFPSLGDVADANSKRRDVISEFVVSFPHDKHMDVIGSNSPAAEKDFGFVSAAFRQEKPKQEKSKEESDPRLCVICHQTYQPQGDSAEEYVTKPPKTVGDAFWLKKGTFKTIPVSHAQCSACHNTEAGIEPAPSKCDVCHKLLPFEKVSVDFDPKLPLTMDITDPMILARWEQRASSATFPHDGGAHPALACTTCHNVPTMNTADAKTLKVAIKSCGGAEGCHITATVDDGGALNFEIDQRKAKAEFQCTKCHLTFGAQPLPENHIAAIPLPAAK